MTRVVVVYTVVALGLIQGAAALEPALGLPAWFDKVVIVLLGIGFPAAVAFAWMFEIRPEGVAPLLTPSGAPSADPDSPGAEGQATRDAAIDRDPRSVAVVPLNNLTGDAAADALADGLTEDLITALAQSPLRLRVTARNSVLKYRHQTGDLREVGRELNVRFIVEGSVQKDGAATKLTLQLINAVSGAHVWAASRNAMQTDDLRKMLAKTMQDWRRLLIDELQGALGNTINEHALAARPASPESFDTFVTTLPDENLFVWSFTTRFGSEGDLERRLRESIAIAERAVERRPNEARNHAWLAFLLMDRMINLGDGNKDAVRTRIWALCQHAIAMDKNDVDVAGFATTALYVSGQMRRAYTLARTLPHAPAYFRDLTLVAFEDDVDGAIERATKRIAAEGAPGDQDRSVLALMHSLRGDYALAIKWAEEAALLYPDIFIPDTVRIFALDRAGRPDEARALAAQVRARWPRGDFAWFHVDPAVSGLDPQSRFAKFGLQWLDTFQRTGLVDTPTQTQAM